VIGVPEHVLADRLLRHDALDETRAVAERQEMDLPARSAVVQPAAQPDGLAFVFRNVFDVNDVHVLPSVFCLLPSAFCILSSLKGH
jgi:hypothetical protein